MKMSRQRIRFLKNNQIIDVVNNFIPQYETDLSLPVEIENLLFLNGINIITHKDLKRTYGIESYITTNGADKIVIDSDIYMNDETRARYALAHEFGHYILHGSFIKSQNISSEEEYFDFRKSITPEEEKRIEIQAHIFAGYTLIPQASFRCKIDSLIENLGGSKNIGIVEFKAIMKDITNQYCCSDRVAFKQLEYEYPKIYEELRATIL